MTNDADEIFEKVRDIVAGCTGVDRSRITMNSGFVDDFGVVGDDGDELFEAFSKEFDVDWTGLDLGVHFGNEGWGLPYPWRLEDNCVVYEVQPCRVSDVVRAVQTGRWPGTKIVPLSKSERRMMYVRSWLNVAFFAGVGLFAAVIAFVNLIL